MPPMRTWLLLWDQIHLWACREVRLLAVQCSPGRILRSPCCSRWQLSSQPPAVSRQDEVYSPVNQCRWQPQGSRGSTPLAWEKLLSLFGLLGPCAPQHTDKPLANRL